MALKDWKRAKISNGDIEFDKKNSPETLTIFYWKSRKLWYVESNKIGVGVIKETKSKSSALKYAKSYMRTH